jgi:hypothetical protein
VVLYNETRNVNNTGWLPIDTYGLSLVSVRKRASDEATGKSKDASQPAIREAAWAIKDVVFIREEPINDTAVVKIV